MQNMKPFWKEKRFLKPGKIQIKGKLITFVIILFVLLPNSLWLRISKDKKMTTVGENLALYFSRCN